MKRLARTGLRFLLCGTSSVFLTVSALCQTAPAESGAIALPDHRHDFDWNVGTWKTHQRRLLKPLTGSTTWVEYNGTDVVRRLWDGATEGLVEADGPAGHLEIFTLRLYNPAAHQWSVSFAAPAGGTLSTPAVGEFKNGRGDFYDMETYNGRYIQLRFSVSAITPTSCHFEQAFSSDGGTTWEVNFVVDETLLTPNAHDRGGRPKAGANP